MKLKIILISFILASANGHSQTDGDVSIVTHQVQMGETVKTISKKYLTSPTEIYKLNKFALDGISAGMVLQVPVPYREPKTSQKTVEENRTVEQNTTRETIVQREIDNKPEPEKPVIKAIVSTPKSFENNSENQQIALNLPDSSIDEIEHVVVAKETLYSLAKQYGTTVDELKNQNPALQTKGLQIGQKIHYKK